MPVCRVANSGSRGHVHERLAQEPLQEPHLGEGVAPADLDVQEHQHPALPGDLHVLGDALGGEPAQPGPVGGGVGLRDAGDHVEGRKHLALAVQPVVARRPAVDLLGDSRGVVEPQRPQRRGGGMAVERHDLGIFQVRLPRPRTRVHPGGREPAIHLDGGGNETATRQQARAPGAVLRRAGLQGHLDGPGREAPRRDPQHDAVDPQRRGHQPAPGGRVGAQEAAAQQQALAAGTGPQATLHGHLEAPVLQALRRHADLERIARRLRRGHVGGFVGCFLGDFLRRLGLRRHLAPRRGRGHHQHHGSDGHVALPEAPLLSPAPPGDLVAGAGSRSGILRNGTIDSVTNNVNNLYE